MTRSKFNNHRYNDEREEEEIKEPLFCVCKRPDDHSFMIQCNFCDEWYHPNCINLDLNIVDTLKEYKCAKCMNSSKTITRESLSSNRRTKTNNNNSNNNSNSIDANINHSNNNPIGSYNESQDIIRTNVMRNFRSILAQYFKNSDDRCNSLAISIELALFNVYSESTPIRYSSFGNSFSFPSHSYSHSHFSGSNDNGNHSNSSHNKKTEPQLFTRCGSNYRSKYRSLHYNLNDSKNNRLREKLFNGEISTDKLVTMSFSEMANEELEKRIIEVRKRSIEQSTISFPSHTHTNTNSNIHSQLQLQSHALSPQTTNILLHDNNGNDKSGINDPPSFVKRLHSHKDEPTIIASSSSKRSSFYNSAISSMNNNINIDSSDDDHSNNDYNNHHHHHETVDYYHSSSNDNDDNDYIWDGFIVLPDVCRIKTFIPNSHFYNSLCKSHVKFMPFTLYVTGKLNVDVALDYLQKIHNSSTSRFVTGFIIFPQELKMKMNKHYQYDNNQDHDHDNNAFERSSNYNSSSSSSSSMDSLVSFLIKQDKVGVIQTDPNGPIKDCYLFIQDTLIRLKHAINNLNVIDESLVLTEVCMVLVLVIQKYHHHDNRYDNDLGYRSTVQMHHDTFGSSIPQSIDNMYNNSYFDSIE